MLILLSPAKTLTPSAPASNQFSGALTQAEGLDVATSIVTALKTWSQEELAQRMKLSATLAERVHGWHQAWQPDSKFAAGWTFKGDAFKSLDLASASEEVVRRAQARLRVLHAVYGLLRPLDQYAPVRLEMAQPWSPTGDQTNMHQHWKTRLPQMVGRHLDETGQLWILNLASAEYSQAALHGMPSDKVVTCQFLEDKRGKLRSVSAFAKAARGAMARHVLEHDLQLPEQLTGFCGLGYVHNPEKSAPGLLVFTRPSRP
ncbi:MAG: YaaA family protein [Flavobacteriales bacterium]